MKTWLFVASVFALAGCDRQQSSSEPTRSSESPDSFAVAQQQWSTANSRNERIALERDKTIADLRSSLASPWTALVIANRYDCSCTGTSYRGIEILATNGAFTVAPWSQSYKPARTGEALPLSKEALEKLISEATLYYLSAAMSVDPREKVGSPPQDATQLGVWRKAYIAAGGSPEATDHHWIEIRVAGEEGLKTYSDMYDRQAPADFFRWIRAFGQVKESP